ncbi:hypothetical protein MMC20_000986, partial [Loxospora ochrophaea]|nr:hypothetical protein [Loxospora ochrophaea]
MSTTAPPPGGDVHRGPGLLQATWIEAAIATIVVTARIFTRSKLARAMGWDDYFIVITL